MATFAVEETAAQINERFNLKFNKRSIAGYPKFEKIPIHGGLFSCQLLFPSWRSDLLQQVLSSSLNYQIEIEIVRGLAAITSFKTFEATWQRKFVSSWHQTKSIWLSPSTSSFEHATSFNRRTYSWRFSDVRLDADTVICVADKT